jgi:ubiquinone/menaquinone biosynthesis C-methylase UbiE
LRDLKSEIQKQFGATAPGYAASVSHSQGATLRDLVELAAPDVGDWVLDVATGTAHSAMAIPPGAGVVVGLDLTPAMLREGAKLARERDLEYIRFVAGDAHRLPFGDGSFDRVVSRTAPHHFADMPSVMREVARVLVPGGRFAVVDGSTPDDAEVDRFVDRLERLHDPTHVRNYTAREWRGFCEAAGLHVVEVREGLFDVMGGKSLAEWSARSHVASGPLAEMRDMLLAASPRVKAALRIHEDGGDIRFDVPKVGLAAVKAPVT